MSKLAKGQVNNTVLAVVLIVVIVAAIGIFIFQFKGNSSNAGNSGGQPASQLVAPGANGTPAPAPPGTASGPTTVTPLGK
ncbi:MAG: hypothetical protein ABFD64_01435 [Armatimonadota bacterium]